MKSYTPNPIPYTLRLRQGFGLIEVLAAAVVLGFLLVGLNLLQKGNRESVLRIRARDAANIIAQQVLDSLGSVGLNSILETSGYIINKDYSASGHYEYTFDGKVGEVKVPFKVQVRFDPNATATDFKGNDGSLLSSNNNTYARSIEATVSWNFNKSSEQSIKMSKVVR